MPMKYCFYPDHHFASLNVTHCPHMYPDRAGLEDFTVQENENQTVRFMTPGVAMRVPAR